VRRNSGTTTIKQENDHILFLSPSLWPQPNASAAGVRTAALLQHFASPNHNSFDQVHYGCGLEEQPTITFPSVQMHHLPSNRSERLLQFTQNDLDGNLKAVVFDRFFAEEAYSFHFYNNGKRSEVLRILDMQDMHSLRYHRQNLIQEMDLDPAANRFGLDHLSQSRVLDSFPMVPYTDERQEGHSSAKNPHLTLVRELAAIHRSDLILVCSPFELKLLRDEYRIHPEKLVLAPFFTKGIEEYHTTSTKSEELQSSIPSPHSFETRRDFVALGGFKHPPNVDQVLILKKYIWPRIREKIPDAKLHIYGSYPPPRIQQLHDAKSGFLVHGYVDDLNLPLGQGRVLLAPLRYGAGIKGKIVDAWRYGCPVVTTPIGAEGIGFNEEEYDNQGQGYNWGGQVASDNDSFIKSAIELYSDERLWMRSQSNARRLLKDLFDAKKNLNVVDDAIAAAVQDMHCRRQRDYTAAMLWHNTARSTEYFSRWIELKESRREDETKCK
jgi:glycosyltransferase involved in cell wall biosynthesis